MRFSTNSHPDSYFQYFLAQHDVKTKVERAQPRLRRNRGVKQGREHRSGWVGGVVDRGGPVSPPPQVMLIGARIHSDAAAERGVRGSDVTKQDRASLSPHKAAVPHLEENGHEQI